MLVELESLRGALGARAGRQADVHHQADHARGLGGRRARRRELDALIADLQHRYEALAAALQADAVVVPSFRPTNYIRSAFHVAGGLFGAALILALSSWPALLVAVAFSFAGAGWFMEISRRRSARVNAALMRVFGRVSHPHEARQINSSTWYASALALLSLTGEPTVMIVGVLILTFADPAAAVIGRRLGRITLINGRTLEGSLTFALTGSAVTFVTLSLLGGPLGAGLIPRYDLGVRLAMAVTAGLLGAVAELFSRRIDDNFSIPVTSALGAWVVLLLTV